MYKIVLITLCFLLLSCSSDSTATGDDIQIKIEVAKELIDDILIVSSEGKKPGTVNPIDTFITLKNNGDNERQVLLKGSWLDANGGLFCTLALKVLKTVSKIHGFRVLLKMRQLFIVRNLNDLYSIILYSKNG